MHCYVALSNVLELMHMKMCMYYSCTSKKTSQVLVIFYCMVSVYCTVCLLISWDQIFVDFTKFLIHDSL